MQIEKEMINRLNVHLASHYGMCFGVRDALAATRSTYNEKEVTVLGQLVHNPLVSQELTENGVKEGDLNAPMTDIEGTVIITAHGASESDRFRWSSPHRRVVDTTCPLVHKVHESLASLVGSGFFPVVIGKKGHAEVNGGCRLWFVRAFVSVDVVSLDIRIGERCTKSVVRQENVGKKEGKNGTERKEPAGRTEATQAS